MSFCSLGVAWQFSDVTNGLEGLRKVSINDDLKFIIIQNSWLSVQSPNGFIWREVGTKLLISFNCLK